MTEAPRSGITPIQKHFAYEVAVSATQEAEGHPSAAVACKSVPVARYPHSLHIPIPDEIYSLRLETLDLSLRVFNLLKRSGISLVGQLLEMDLTELKLARLGERSIEEVIRAVQACGLLDSIERSQEEDKSEASQASLDPTSTTSIVEQAHFLKHGWQTWGITFAAPLGQNPQLWHHAGHEQGQWSLPYRHGDFPLTPGTIVTYDGPRTRLRHAREDRDLCRSELAEKIGYRREDIFAWEKGTTNPGPDAISKLCLFFEGRK